MARFHDSAAAEKEKDEFIARFQKGAMPQEIPEVSVSGEDGKLGIAHLLREAGLVASTSILTRYLKNDLMADSLRAMLFLS